MWKVILTLGKKILPFQVTNKRKSTCLIFENLNGCALREAFIWTMTFERAEKNTTKNGAFFAYFPWGATFSIERRFFLYFVSVGKKDRIWHDVPFYMTCNIYGNSTPLSNIVLKWGKPAKSREKEVTNALRSVSSARIY